MSAPSAPAVPAPAPAAGSPRWVRAVHAGVFVLTSLTLLVQFVLTGTGPAHAEQPDPGVAVSVIRFFSFFTIDSNVLVAAMALHLALGRPWNLPARVLRIVSVVAISITGVVHWFLLRPLGTEDGILGVLDVLMHIVVPILAVLTWLLAGPRVPRAGRPRTSALVLGILVFPAAYALWTFAHGAATGWYPYPFIDVVQIGYPAALRMAGLVLGSFLVLSVVVEGVERLLGRARRAA